MSCLRPLKEIFMHPAGERCVCVCVCVCVCACGGPPVTVSLSTAKFLSVQIAGSDWKGKINNSTDSSCLLLWSLEFESSVLHKVIPQA